MDIVLLIVGALVLSVMAVAPALLVWSLSSLWLPAWYSMPPVRMTLLSVGLSVVTSYVLQAELPDGTLSVAPLILALSLAWSLVLIPVIAVFRYYRYDQTKTHSKRPFGPLKNVTGRAKKPDVRELC